MGIRKYLELNNIEDTKYKNLWDAAKIVLIGKSVQQNAYIHRD